MKYLMQFLVFCWAQFALGKVFQVTGLREWVDYTTKEKRGWCVDTVIVQDKTKYKAKAGEIGSNLYEKVTFKVEAAARPSVNIGDSVEPVGEPTCTVFGDYRNQLSVRCAGVQVVPPAAGKKEN